MILQDFMPADKVVAVEQLNMGRKQGCVVRWNFKTIKNKIPTAYTRKMRRIATYNSDAETPTEQQYIERDSGFVSFCVKVYQELPTANVVISDIEADLSARYKDGNRPDIDWEQYRIAIENLHRINNK